MAIRAFREGTHADLPQTISRYCSIMREEVCGIFSGCQTKVENLDYRIGALCFETALVV